MMKILVLTPQILYPWWYYGRYSMYFLIKYLKKKGLDIYLSFPIANIDNNKQNIEHLEKIGIKVFPFQMDTADSIFKLIKNVFEKDPFKINKYFSSEYSFFLEDLCMKINPDIIQVHSSHMFKVGFNVAKKIGIPIILRQQDIVHEQVKNFERNVKNPIYKLIAKWQYYKTYEYERKIWKLADKIVFLTHKDYEYFIKFHDRLKDKAIMIPDGIEKQENLYIKNKNNRINGFCFIASDQIPNVISLKWFLNLWKKIYAQFPLSFHVYGKVCNAFLDKQDELRRYRVFLHGFVESKEKLNEEISKYLFFISPTITGSGYRTKIFDAASIGMVVVCTEFDYEGVSFILERDKDIFVFKDEKELSGIIRKIIDNQIALDNISTKVHKKLQENLSWDVIADRFIELYKELRS
jgi:glycosyltransferase involved in cell wall biosynthesis